MIGITQPRRVAAISMAERVSFELGIDSTSCAPSNKRVAYQIRYENTLGKDTEIKFMTDGILLKEIQSDFLLRKYSAILIDEAHERTINTDILIGLLSRIVPLRSKMHKQNPEDLCPLKLIIMSATLRVTDFISNQKLFSQPPPVIKVNSRQFPVTVHFNKVTPEDYVEEAFKKVKKIHQKLPPGAILVFLTGKQEITRLCTKLSEHFPILVENSDKEVKEEISEKSAPKNEVRVKKEAGSEEEKMEETATNDPKKEEKEKRESAKGMYVLPLYSSLAQEEQMKVFENAPAGSRMVVVATNVAETSLTIPHVSYVVDCGKSKQKVWLADKSVSAFQVAWISKASADQRAGRSGRTCPGHCYRLYSSSVFENEFPSFSPPEISVTPIEELVLQMKSMNIDKILNFPFPTPPPSESVERALKTLTYLGALKKLEVMEKEKLKTKFQLTNLGSTLSRFPVSPRYGKMLVLAMQHNVLNYVVAIVAGLSAQHSPFVFYVEEVGEVEGEEREEKKKERKEKRRQMVLESKRKWGGEESDCLAMLSSIGAFHYAGKGKGGEERQRRFCVQHNLNYKVMVEIEELRKQLARVLFASQESLSAKLEDINSLLQLSSKPSTKQQTLIRKLLAGGLIDQVARKEEENVQQPSYSSLLTGEPLYLHPASLVASEKPEYVVYKEVVATSKSYMRQVTSVKPEWLSELSPALTSMSTPLPFPLPRYDPLEQHVKCWVQPRFGPLLWKLPKKEVPFPGGSLYLKYLAKFLLEGFVCPKLAPFQQHLIVKTSLLTSDHNDRDPLVFPLLKPLLDSKISSGKDLLDKWATEKLFLLKPLLSWYQPSIHTKIASIWPPI